jgi:hypothetical protein
LIASLSSFCVLCTQMVSVSLDCLLLIVPLSLSCVLCTQWCQCLLIVHSGFSICLRPVSCVPNWCQYLLIVHSWLSFCLRSASCVPKWCQCLLIVPLNSFCVLCTQWCQCLWIVHSGFSNVYLTRKIGTFSLNLTLFFVFVFFCFGFDENWKIWSYVFCIFHIILVFFVVLRQFDDIVYVQNKNIK